jgi:G3E family GTPase
MPSPPVPTALITGFLGSGKTTLLNGLLQHTGMADTAVIVNEFGEIGLDHLLIETAFEDAVLLKSGCICCTVRGDLVDTIETLDQRRRSGAIPAYRRIAIETTGLADPAPIMTLLMEEVRLRDLVTLDRVIATVDAANALSTLDAHYESAKQVALADRLVLTKTDLVTAEMRRDVEARLRRLNPEAPIIVAVAGHIAPGVLFDADLTPGSRHDRLAAAEGLGGHAHHHGDAADAVGHLAQAHGISSFTLWRDQPIEWENLRAWLEALASLKGPDLLRMKGIVNIAGRAGPVVLHGVQHVFHPPQELARWPDADRRSRIVFITRNIPQIAVAGSFAAAMAGRGASNRS